MRTRLLPILTRALLLWTAMIPMGLLAQDRPPKVVLVIHGGAGVLTDQEMKEDGRQKEDYEHDLGRALKAGYQVL